MIPILLPLGAANITVASLAVEHLIAPEGIDVTAPRFSWHIEPPAGARGVVPLAVAWEVRAAGELRLNVTVPPGCVGEVDVPGNASELVVSESGVVLWRRGAAAGTAEGVTAVAALVDGVRLSTASGSYMVVAE